jgi:hypothetical protein
MFRHPSSVHSPLEMTLQISPLHSSARGLYGLFMHSCQSPVAAPFAIVNVGPFGEVAKLKSKVEAGRQAGRQGQERLQKSRDMKL